MNNIILFLLLDINVCILISKLIKIYFQENLVMSPFIFVWLLIFYFNLKAIVFFILYRFSKKTIIEKISLYKKYIGITGLILLAFPLVNSFGLELFIVYLNVLVLPVFIICSFIILIDLINLRNILFNLIFIFYIAAYTVFIYFTLVIQSGKL